MNAVVSGRLVMFFQVCQWLFFWARLGETSFQRKMDSKTPRSPKTIKTMGVNITTIDSLRVLIIEIGEKKHYFNGGVSA